MRWCSSSFSLLPRARKCLKATVALLIGSLSQLPKYCWRWFDERGGASVFVGRGYGLWFAVKGKGAVERITLVQKRSKPSYVDGTSYAAFWKFGPLSTRDFTLPPPFSHFTPLFSSEIEQWRRRRRFVALLYLRERLTTVTSLPLWLPYIHLKRSAGSCHSC